MDDTMSPSSGDASKPKVIKFALILIFFGVIVLVATMIWQAIQRPAAGTVKAPATNTAEAPDTTSIKQLKASTFSLGYPSEFSLSPMGPKTSYSGIDNVILTGTRLGTTEHIAISVIKDTNGLANEPSYHLRKIQPNLYTETLRPFGTDTAHVMTRTDEGYEQTVFVEHHGLLAMIAQTSTNPDIKTQTAIIDPLLSSWQWQPAPL